MVARALEESWEPTSELVLWQAVDGLGESEGLTLLNRWQSQNLLPEEDRARQHVGELLRWHPAALCLYAGEAHAASWQNVEALVLEGNLNPGDFDEMASWIQKSWDRLLPADQEAMSGLRRILQEASTFGTGFAAAVWDKELPQAVLHIKRIEAPIQFKTAGCHWRLGIADVHNPQARIHSCEGVLPLHVHGPNPAAWAQQGLSHLEGCRQPPSVGHLSLCPRRQPLADLSGSGGWLRHGDQE